MEKKGMSKSSIRLPTLPFSISLRWKSPPMIATIWWFLMRKGKEIQCKISKGNLLGNRKWSIHKLLRQLWLTRNRILMRLIIQWLTFSTNSTLSITIKTQLVAMSTQPWISLSIRTQVWQITRMQVRQATPAKVAKTAYRLSPTQSVKRKSSIWATSLTSSF